MGTRYEFGILGPLEVRADGVLLPVGGPRQRALLAMLLCDANRVVSRDRLIDELLGDQPAESADRTLRVQVSRLRKALSVDGEQPRVSARPPGYIVRVEPGELDLLEFDRLVRAGRAALERADPGEATALLGQAERLWRGRPLADLEFEPFARVEVQRLEELRLTCTEERIDVDLALGRHAALCPELEALVEEHPLRERLRGQLMLALYRTGRQAEALACYRAGRSLLVDELALEPGPRLKQLEQAILTQDPALDLAGRDRVAVAVDQLPAPALEPEFVSKAPVERRDRRSPTHKRRVLGGALIGAVLVAATAVGALVAAGGSGSRLRAPPNSLAVIDAHSNSVVAVVPVGSSPGPIAVGSGSVWVANVADRTVSRVDPVALRMVSTLPLGATPTGLAASSDAIWVVQSNPGSSSVLVRRIDPQFDALDPARELGNVVPGGPGSVTGQGNSVWVAPSSGLLARFDSVTGRLVQHLDPNASPAGVAVGDGAVWVTDSDANNVTRVSPTGLSTPITVGNAPSAIAVGEGAVWVADTLDGTVKRIDPSTSAVTTTIPVGRSPSALAVGDGSIWVADSGDGTITRIDPGTDQATATIRVGGSPEAIAIGSGRVWVSVDAAETTPTLAASAGTLRMETLADLDSLDPALAYSAGSWQLLYATCAKLLNYPDRSGSAGSELTPEVATGLPALSADRRTYTFTIRPGFRFSPPSDQAVTAQTFEATIERTLNPRMKSPIAYEFGNVAGAVPYMGGKADRISGVRARGDKLIIRLLRPEPDIPSRLAQPFFCAVPTDTPIDPAGLRVIPSAGPYYVTSYIPGQSVVLARNPNYRGSRPHRLQRIVLELGVSSERAVGDIEAGRADYTSIGGTPASTVSALAARLAAQYGPASPAAARHRQQYFAASQHPELDFLILNTHRPLFSDLRLRQAVNYAIDRQQLARLGDGYGSADRPATQYLPPGMPGFTPSPAYPITPDLPKARALASGHGRTAVLYSCDYAACRELAQIVSNDLDRIGLRAEIKIFDHSTLYARLATPNEPFDIAFGTWLTDYPDPGSMLNGMLADPSLYPTFHDQGYQRALAATGQLTGPERYLAFGKLALRLARDAAPIIAYGNGVSEQEFFSSRIGCQTYAFYVGADLAALCARPGSRRAR